MIINVINPIFSKVSTKEDAEFLASFLKYKSTYWKQGPFRKIEKEWQHPLVKKGIFLTGFIPKIIHYCTQRNIHVEAHQDPLTVSRYCVKLDLLELPGGLKLKQDQIDAIDGMFQHLRGVVHHPTGSGKTIIFLSFISLFPDARSLIIVNTQDLLFQTVDRAEGFFPGEVGMMGAGVDNPKRITVATIQTLNKIIDPESSEDFFKNLDIVIVDETHHISRFAAPFTSKREEGGSYGKVLSAIHAPIRIGFTGTLPYTEEGKMALEGYLGPVISTKKIQEIERLAKIKIRFRKLPITQSAKEAKTYQDVYKYGVTFNSRRNKAVLQEANELVQSGKTVLILVTLVQHGTNILTMAKRSFPHLRIEFVWGGIQGWERDLIKRKLNNKELDVVIADAVWKEGVDIPSLGSIINSAGGKSEINTIQTLGRGLRTVPGKDDVILVDFFDPSHKYLIEHFGQRLCLYFEEGWM